DSQVCWQQVRVGEFLLVYPEDAHAPLVGEGKQRKLIIKVRI
ncbi:MAG: YhcH/YjgK/YiaL family protein, partial [Bacteroidaceae bacterium]|nr:YhcH/YjgK/YiaL family protein [Bacteroidaceae bacterium]